MENTQTNQTSYKQQQLTYSPPHHPTDESHEPSIPVRVPTLTPPHSLNTTTIQHKQQNYQSPPKSTQVTPFTSSTSQKQSLSISLDTASVNKPTNQRLPPRKRIQSLKKQYTKPNLSAPVIPVLQTTTTEAQETPSTCTKVSDQPSSSISYTTFSYTNSRSPSPLVDIEDDSGETTETDDDDWQQRKTTSISETTLKDDDDDNLFKPTKHAIIINQQETLPTPSPDRASTKTTLNKTQKPKKLLKKHWDPSSLQSPSRGLDRQDDKVKKSKKKKGRASLMSEDPTQPTKIQKTGSEGRPSKSRMKKSGALYCICQTPYDAPRFMIACDRCDQWFHGECIEISEKEGEFIDLYFCDICRKETGKSTSWKSKCGNPACPKAARISSHQGNLSKYCSHECGMQVARARLELTEMKKRQSTDETETDSIPQITLNKQRQSRLASNAEKQDQHRLEQLRKQKLRALDMVRMIEQKQHFIELTAQHTQESDLCGFDSRLVWDDPFWIQVQRIDDTGPVFESKEDTPPPFWQCQSMKKECRQHQHWQRILDLEMKQERKEQLQVIKRLEKEKQDIKNRMRQRRNQVDLVDALGNGTITY